MSLPESAFNEIKFISNFHLRTDQYASHRRKAFELK